jgi:hypothetical protein
LPLGHCVPLWQQSCASPIEQLPASRQTAAPPSDGTQHALGASQVLPSHVSVVPLHDGGPGGRADPWHVCGAAEEGGGHVPSPAQSVPVQQLGAVVQSAGVVQVVVPGIPTGSQQACPALHVKPLQ